MLKYGYSTDQSNQVVCAVKQWKDKDCTAGYLLFSYGTLPDPMSVCPDSHMRCLKKTEGMLQEALEQLGTMPDQSDHAYIAAYLNDVMQKSNLQIREIAAFLGQCICIGGVITFIASDRYLIIPFGGGEIYLWLTGNELKRIGEQKLHQFISANPIGCYQMWTGKYWTGSIQAGMRVILTSVPIEEDKQILQVLTEGSKPESHDHTLALLLRQQLEKTDLKPVAVLDLHL